MIFSIVLTVLWLGLVFKTCTLSFFSIMTITILVVQLASVLLHLQLRFQFLFTNLIWSFMLGIILEFLSKRWFIFLRAEGLGNHCVFFNIVLCVLSSEAMLLHNSLHLQSVSQNKDRSDFLYCSFEPSSACGESQTGQRSDAFESWILALSSVWVKMKVNE